MDLTNESYLIKISGKNWTERYYRDKRGWVKVSARGREFRATAEQVLNHLLPALAGVKANVVIRVEHRQAPRGRPPARRARAPPVTSRAGPPARLAGASGNTRVPLRRS